MIWRVDDRVNIHRAERSEDSDRPLAFNESLADRFDEIARLLDSQLENPFRVQAWRQGAAVVRSLERPVDQIFREEGLPGLEELPHIGRSLSRAIAQFVNNGHIPALEQLREESTPERQFASVPGIGPELAERIHQELGVETLGELLSAATDGRLAKVKGFGPRRIQVVRSVLEARRADQSVSHSVSAADSTRRRVPPNSLDSRLMEEPTVEELLDVDLEYRRQAELGRLRKIAPRRFNPTGAAWLPILQTNRGDRDYHALYSNSARAHELGMTSDWVVISRDDDGHHGQWTVVTSSSGPLKGNRIVRGREAECLKLYETGKGTPVSGRGRTSRPSGVPTAEESVSDGSIESAGRPRRRQLSLFPQLASAVRP